MVAALYNSRVICEYLDQLPMAVGGCFPQTAASAGTRCGCRHWATVSWMLRCWRATRHSCGPRSCAGVAWVDGQLDKVHRGLDRIEAVDASGFGGRVDIGTITIACALGYLDFRFADAGLARPTPPALAAWFEEFGARALDAGNRARADLIAATVGCARAAARRGGDRVGQPRSGSPLPAQRNREQRGICIGQLRHQHHADQRRAYRAGEQRGHGGRGES